MKKITLIVLFLIPGIFIARAGNEAPQKISNVTTLENNFRNTMWYNSYNRAGLSFSPLDIYHTLNIKYDIENGLFRSPEKPVSEHDISLNTSGAVFLGKFMLCGDFSFRNNFKQKAKYNASLYDIEDNMPYYLADTNNSNWIKQEYDLAASLSSPIIANKISLGLQAHYITKVGAKQKDPRCETYKYSIEVIPSMVILLKKNHYVGINGVFENYFERSTPSLNNYRIYQKVIYNKGLGEGIVGMVGSGVSTSYYKSMKYGGGIQYAYEKKMAILVDIDYLYQNINVFENPGMPKRLGSTKSNNILGNIQLFFGKSRNNKFTFSGLYSGTKGIEHVQQMSKEAFNQHWVILASNEMSKYSRIFAEFDYDHLFGNDLKRGYNWIVGSKIKFSDRNYEYHAPFSKFTATSTFFNVNGGKNFKFKNSSLLIALNCGYNLTLRGTYNYGGNMTDSWQVEYYNLVNQYLTTDFIDVGGRIAYSISTEKVNFVIDINADWNKPLTIKNDRIICTASFGIIF